ncbi:MAG: 50S ribosomal protein L31e [Candidatus Micrarchaeota archaeon]|nr:50S ribosomal protein L31e [Candidatus Micrarchaeota archaeon]
MATLERIYTIPLGKVYSAVRNKRGRKAIQLIRGFAARHLKAESVKISEGVNSLVLRDGIQKPPRRIKVRIVKDDKGTAKVWLIGEEEKAKELAEAKKKEEEAKKKEEGSKKEEKKEEAKKKQEGQQAPQLQKQSQQPKK